VPPRFAPVAAVRSRCCALDRAMQSCSKIDQRTKPPHFLITRASLALLASQPSSFSGSKRKLIGDGFRLECSKKQTLATKERVPKRASMLHSSSHPSSTNSTSMSRIRRQVLGVLLLLAAPPAPPAVLVAAFAPAIVISRTSSSSSSFSSFFQRHQPSPPLQQSTFTADGSEYSADKSDFDGDDDELQQQQGWNRNNNNNNNDEDDETPTVELQPVPISKNAGNRFVAVIWDRLLQKNNDDNDKDALDWHYDRIALTEEHVMFCRKQNLYNATFNTESLVDILWSLPM